LTRKVKRNHSKPVCEFDLATATYSKDDAAAIWRLLGLQRQLAKVISKTKKLDLLRTIDGQTTTTRRLEWAEYLLTCMTQEIAETRDCLPWKKWRRYKGYDFKKMEKNIRFEVVDILHFWLQLCLVLGISATDIVKYYFVKCEINSQRQKNNY
jgi:dimeric dUTPase (all-alpha-NTP-PPase superfamily)